MRKNRKPKRVKADSTKIQKGFIKKDKELVIESNRGKQAPCADTYLMRETAKERNINWCEEYKFKKVILLNYTERGKQSITTTTTTTKTTNTITPFYPTLLTYTTILNYLFITLSIYFIILFLL